VKIQEYLIAAIKNIEVLLRYGEQLKKSLLVKVNQVKKSDQRSYTSYFGHD
jgi:hypothetical protein